jgi:hypothetical protein
MTVRWEELTEEERVTLVALSQSPVLTLTAAMATRLEALGLAQPGFGGTVISAAGRELIWKRPAISSQRERRVRQTCHGTFRTRLGVCTASPVPFVVVLVAYAALC